MAGLLHTLPYKSFGGRLDLSLRLQHQSRLISTANTALTSIYCVKHATTKNPCKMTEVKLYC